MIKGFYFSLSFNWPAEKRPINEISERLICLFQDLSDLDNRFSIPIFLPRIGKEVELDLKNNREVNRLSDLILSSVKPDIAKHDKMSFSIKVNQIFVIFQC